ncbi:MAG: zinc ribbon domain-containing protein [Acidimicrobiia bacterium]
MTTNFCPGCGAEYQPDVAVCPECGLLLDTEGALVYEMDGWEQGERDALSGLLADEDVAHRWEGDDLLVPEECEDRVDALMDRVEFPDALEAVEGGDDEVDDEAVYAVMSDLFVATDRPARERTVDIEAAGEVATAADAATNAPPPYGVEPAAWKQVQQMAEGIVASLEAEADDEVVVGEAAALRDVLRRLV